MSYNVYGQTENINNFNRPLNMYNTQINSLLAPVLNTDAANKGYVDNSISSVSAGFLKIDGTNAMTAALNVGTNLINNVVDPTLAQQAATKNYVDNSISTVSGFLKTDGTNLMTAPLNMGGNVINNIFSPVTPNQAVNKNYVDVRFLLYLRLDGTATMIAPLNMGGNTINSVSEPINPQQAATKNYVDTNISGFLKTNGTNQMNADLNMGTNLINNVVDPTLAQQAATKNYVDTNVSGFLKTNGTNAMTAALNMGNNVINNIANPIFTQQAATKNYVDGNIAGLLRVDGSNVMIAALDVGNNVINNVVNPTTAQQAATKNYVDTSKNLFISVTNPVATINWVRMVTIAGTEGGVLYCDIKEKNTDGIGALAAQLTLVLRHNGLYQYTLLPWAGGTLNIAVNATGIWMKRNFNATSFLKLSVSYTPYDTAVAVDGTTNQVGNPVGFIDTTGGPGYYNGPNNVRINGILDPTAAQQAATKNYVDNSAFLRTNGTNQMTAALNMGNKLINNVVDPALAHQAATKNYVDNRALLPASRFQYPVATGLNTYQWTTTTTIPAGLTEAEFDNLPAGFYACLTTNLPATRLGAIPTDVKAYLTCYSYENGPTVYNKRYTLIPNSNLNNGAIYIASIVENVWATWVFRTF